MGLVEWRSAFGYITPRFAHSGPGRSAFHPTDLIDVTDRSRRLWGVVSILLIIVLVLAAVGAWLVRRSFPTVDGRAIVAPLNASVDVVRDAYGMVHITASSTTDAYRALGYVHAQDRLWQMELIRRVGMGRLAEAVGAAGIPVDRLLRTIGLWEVAVRTEGILDAETRDALTAYAEGVNAHINSTKGRPILAW